jgi:hypothetical protein
MDTDSEETSQDKINIADGNKEPTLQFHWYMFGFAIIYAGSFVLPGIIFFSYFTFFFVPVFLETSSFISLFTEILPLVSLLLIPLVIMFSYFLHLILVALITRWLWGITEKKSPSKDGNIPRNVPSKTLNYYHIRSFMIKYGKNAFIKGPFPWLSNWFFNTVKSNVIGKGTIIEEQVCADKFIEVGDNCYIGVNSVLTSHLVEGIFGRITYFKLRVGDNVTMAGLNMYASGCHIHDDAYLLPMACGGKHYKLKGNNYYFGRPVHKIFKKKLMEYLKLTKEELDKDKELRLRRKQLKNRQNEESSS